MISAFTNAEEVRDALLFAERDTPHAPGRTVAWLADDLAVSVSTTRRHLATLVQRGHVTCDETTRPRLFTLTPRGRVAADTNEGL